MSTSRKPGPKGNIGMHTPKAVADLCAVVEASPLKLTPDAMRLLASYAAMNMECKSMLVELSEKMAQRSQAAQVRPHLQLVSSHT